MVLLRTSQGQMICDRKSHNFIILPFGVLNITTAFIIPVFLLIILEIYIPFFFFSHSFMLCFRMYLYHKCCTSYYFSFTKLYRSRSSIIKSNFIIRRSSCISFLVSACRYKNFCTSYLFFVHFSAFLRKIQNDVLNSYAVHVIVFGDVMTSIRMHLQYK